MKGAIFYYSGSGNTKLACQAIVKKVPSIEFSLIDIVGLKDPGLENYGICGFATFADFVGPPKLFIDFVKSLSKQNGKPAFVLNTFGGFGGRTLLVMSKLLKNRGFQVLAGHGLHTPENYPPLITKGRGFEHSPDGAELAAFKAFMADLDSICSDLKASRPVQPRPIRVGMPGVLIPSLPRKAARWDMGRKTVDEKDCTACGMCAKLCPYGAITLAPKPVFDQKKCYGCWACYNHCPAKAVQTKKLKGEGQYAEPNGELKGKLG